MDIIWLDYFYYSIVQFKYYRMQNDDMIWDCVNNGFCSFKFMTKTQMLCKNDNNVLGLCCKSACPISNSKYATIKEHKGKIYLCKKVVERAAFPNKLWDKIPLPQDYEQALQMIDQELMYWESKIIHRCKQRYTKIIQYLERSRKLATKMRSKKLITLPRKIERREKRREAKALIAAKLENNIEIEIMDRIKQGVYGDKYKLKNNNVFEEALVDEELEDSHTINAETSKHSDTITIADKYVAADDISDIEDMFDESSDSDLGEDWTTDEEDDEAEIRKKKKQKVTIEYEKPKKLEITNSN